MSLQSKQAFFSAFIDFKNLTRYHWLFIFGVFTLANIPAILNDWGNTNLSVMLGDAFLHGRTTIPHYFIDVSVFENKFFSPFPPFPALLTIPFTVLFGAENVNSVALCTVMSFVSIYCLVQIINKTNVPNEYRFWIIFGYLFGTGYWYTLITSHHVSGFNHVTSTALLLLAIVEVFNKKRAWLIALLVGCSFLSRQMTVFYSIFFVLYFFFFTEGKKKYQDIVVYSITLLPFIGIYMIYNYYRFHNPLDTGYEYLEFIPVFKARVQDHGLFSIHYIPYNLYHLLIKGPNILFKGDEMADISGIDRVGTSLLIASPFVLVALKAKCDPYLKFCLWAAILAVMIGGLMYFNNGADQINTQRFSLDFLPLMVLLIGYGCSSIPKWLFRNLVIFSFLLNVFSFFIHLFYYHMLFVP